MLPLKKKKTRKNKKTHQLPDVLADAWLPFVSNVFLNVRMKVTLLLPLGLLLLLSAIKSRFSTEDKHEDWFASNTVS